MKRIVFALLAIGLLFGLQEGMNAQGKAKDKTETASSKEKKAQKKVANAEKTKEAKAVRKAKTSSSDKAEKAEAKAEKKAAKVTASKASREANTSASRTSEKPVTKAEGKVEKNASKNKARAEKATNEVTSGESAPPARIVEHKPAPRTPKTMVTSSQSQNSNDKVIGKDDKGRTLYEGPRGGHYYINAEGNKEYVKK